MKNNKQIITMVSIFVLAYLSCNLNNAYADKGWYKTEWYMTIDQAQSVLKEEIKEIPDETQKKNKNDFTHQIHDFKIGDFSFTVLFAFDSQRGLQKVAVKMNGESDAYKCFLELEQALKKKYGPPTLSKDDPKSNSAELKKREWTTANTIIGLVHLVLWIDKEANEYTSISYQAREDEKTDKL